jgi:hypothetical protein
MVPGHDRAGAHSLDEGLPALLSTFLGNLVGEECVVPADNGVSLLL